MIRSTPAVRAFATVLMLTAAMAACADDDRTPPPGYGMQPGMMGQGMPGYGMQPGMMGQGMPGYGMMGGRMMGPGMMMAPGMMGGGMMMGPGMMGGYGPGAGLNLDDKQRKTITQIQDDLHKTHWDLMGRMNTEYAKLRDLYAADRLDPGAIGKQQLRIDDLRRQMTVTAIEAQNRMEDALTPEQKRQLRGMYGRCGMMGCW